MGFFSSIANFLAKPIVGTIGSIATGLLGQKGANDRKEQQIAMTQAAMCSQALRWSLTLPEQWFVMPAHMY